jgi:hypothetical protein
VRNLAGELQARGHKVSHVLVAELLHEQKYSLQANRKTKEGSSHPDRNAQFEYMSRVRLWKLELQKLADETGLRISVCHFPPGTSTWNKLEHRLFSFITKNWRGQPLVSHEVIVNLIAATTTRAGLRVQSQLDTRKYPKGMKVGKEEFAAIPLHPDPYHGDWNYTIMPRS